MERASGRRQGLRSRARPARAKCCCLIWPEPFLKRPSGADWSDVWRMLALDGAGFLASTRRNTHLHKPGPGFMELWAKKAVSIEVPASRFLGHGDPSLRSGLPKEARSQSSPLRWG